MNLALFAVAAAGVWLAGTRVSLYADAISDRMRIGKELMGLIFLATATSIPEIVTTVTAALNDKPHLLLNGLFGGITMQTAVLALADASVPAATLTFYPRKPNSALEGTLLMILLALMLVVAELGEVALVWHVGLGTVVVALAYGLTVALLRHYDATSSWVPVELPEEAEIPLTHQSARDLDAVPFDRLLWRTAGAVAMIVGCGMAIVWLSEALAVQTGLGTSFIGVTILATATSLPELSTTIAAVRLGAYTMAISNIFGSNLILVALVLPADILYRPGLLLAEMDRSVTFALTAGLVATGVYVAGLLLRNKLRVLGMGIDSAIVLVLYAISLVIFYTLR